MHVKARTLAFGGLLLALSVVFMALGSIIETSTLFLLAAASFFVGIVVREFGLRAGAAFYIAAVLLGFITAPINFMCLPLRQWDSISGGSKRRGDGWKDIRSTGTAGLSSGYLNM